VGVSGGGIWPNAPQRKYRDSSDLVCETPSPRIRWNRLMTLHALLRDYYGHRSERGVTSL
jgi:hypothetical protein